MVDLARLDLCFIAGTLGQGGAERQLFYIIKTLKECGSRVRLMCLTKGEFWESIISSLDVPVVWIGQQPSRLMRLMTAIQTLRSDRPQILQSQHFYTNLYAAMAAHALGIREVGAMRNNCLSEVQANGAVIGRLSLRVPRFLAANSRAAIENAKRFGIQTRRLHLLPNVIDTDLFTPAAHRRTEAIHLLAVGRLVSEKRLDRFLLMIAQLRQRSSSPVKGTIVGDGPLRRTLERQARDLGLMPEAVEFRGAVSDMAPVYRTADVLVLTSEFEGTPNVLLEAMASGLPVVATRVGGVAEIVRNEETGYIAEIDDEETMILTLLKLIENPDQRERMGSMARAYLLANHSLKHLPEMLAEIYAEVLL